MKNNFHKERFFVVEMMQWSKNLEAVMAIKPKSCTKTQQQANKWKTYQTCADRIFFDF